MSGQHTNSFQAVTAHPTGAVEKYTRDSFNVLEALHWHVPASSFIIMFMMGYYSILPGPAGFLILKLCEIIN